MDADFVDLQEDTVHLLRKSDNKVIKVPLARLGEDERRLLGPLRHADQVEAASHLLRRDVAYFATGEGRIIDVALYNLDAPVVDADLEQIGHLTSIHTLSITVASGISAEGMAHLSKLTNLRELRLSCSDETNVDALVQALAPLNGLTQFELTACRSINDASLEVVAGWANLEMLSIHEQPTANPGVTDVGVRRLASLRNLKHLWLTTSHVSEESLSILDSMPGLWSLRWSSPNHPLTGAGARRIIQCQLIFDLRISAESVEDDALELLGQMPAITTLDLSSCQLGDAQIRHLAHLSKLDHLVLSDNPIQGPGLAHLSGLSKLKWLEFEDVPLRGDNLMHLRSLSSLETLSLHRTALTDADLPRLKELTALRSLFLDENAITDVGLKHLEGMRGLTTVQLSGCHVTEAGIETLREALPGPIVGFDPEKPSWSPEAAGDDRGAMAATPEAAFESLRKAVAADDWEAGLRCFTDEGRETLVAQTILMMHMGEFGDQGPAVAAEFADAAALDKIAAAARGARKISERRRLALPAAALVADQPGLMRAFLGRLGDHKEVQDNLIARLSEIRLRQIAQDGDTASVELGWRTGPNTTVEQEIRFRRIEGTWYLEL